MDTQAALDQAVGDRMQRFKASDLRLTPVDPQPSHVAWQASVHSNSTVDDLQKAQWLITNELEFRRMLPAPTPP